MIRRSARIVLAPLLILTVVSSVHPAGEELVPSMPCEQASDDSFAVGDSIEAVDSAASSDSTGILSADAFVFRPRYDLRHGTALTLSMRPQYNSSNMFGFEVYKASRLECALYGAGAGASLGMTTGAFGMMTGTWDERTAWYITGAMAAFGAVFGGGIKADDPGWNLRIRWDPDR